MTWKFVPVASVLEKVPDLVATVFPDNCRFASLTLIQMQADMRPLNPGLFQFLESVEASWLKIQIG